MQQGGQHGGEMKKISLSKTDYYITKYGESLCLLKNYEMSSWLSTARREEV